MINVHGKNTQLESFFVLIIVDACEVVKAVRTQCKKQFPDEEKRIEFVLISKTHSLVGSRRTLIGRC